MTAAAVAAPLALKAVNVEAPPRAVRIGGAAESIVQDEQDPPSGPVIDINETRDGRGNIGPAPDGSQNTETVGDADRSAGQGRQARSKPTTTAGSDLTEGSPASAAGSDGTVEEPATTVGSIGESTLTAPPEPDPSTTSSAPPTTTTTTATPTTPTSTSTSEGPEATVSIPTTTSSTVQTGSSGSTLSSSPTGNN